MVRNVYSCFFFQVTSRLDYIWKEQAEKEQENMKCNRELNDTLIKVSLEKKDILFVYFTHNFYILEYFARSCSSSLSK